ncbi:SigB/SigF/SigG family RNA polymerase sigma factor [Streptomyces sp. SID5785]|uniref:SigB/SigF/SigG family RNA polymerase sigma factor n=1 Tax=Streptomyces sp. SID5785 TaxID=2690309 RepID=UPI0013619542|nr:SigB/SigF/SigG family RNA polymerase sigma factor [Streptomyces sp. SID5785]MZD07130.1 SigB/SigF/SigG family RNA polymerase sigma factor [Streptomyces sp. SID5785]
MTTHRVHDDTPDTELTFVRLARSTAGREHDALSEELVTAWLPMAHRLAGRFRNKGESMADLEQVAAVGLVKAVDRYDPGQGAFEPFAVPTITGELRRHFRDHTWGQRVPRRVQDLRNRVRFARRDLMERADHPEREPSTGDIARETGMTREEVREGAEALHSYRGLSLEAETAHGDDSSEGVSLADRLGTPDPGYERVTDREAAKEGIRQLPERERTILYLRFFEDMTQASIADELGISQMHVSRLISRSCARIREEAGAPQCARW